jgi:cytohesin
MDKIDNRYIVFLVAVVVIIAVSLLFIYVKREKEIYDFITSIMKNDISMAKSILKKNPELAKIKIKCNNSFKIKLWLTPLFYAHSKDMAELLIDYGADVNARNTFGSSPLHSIVCFPYTDTAQLLISRGADINAKDNEGQTPLHVATVSGHYEMVKLLISNGADMKVRDHKGYTALKDALVYYRSDIANLLRKHGVKE